MNLCKNESLPIVETTRIMDADWTTQRPVSAKTLHRNTDGMHQSSEKCTVPAITEMEYSDSVRDRPNGEREPFRDRRIDEILITTTTDRRTAM